MTLTEILEKVDNVCPEVKSSEKLYIVGLIQDAYRKGYKDASETALSQIKGFNYETTKH